MTTPHGTRSRTAQASADVNSTTRSISLIPQSQAAQQMYDPRAASYDDSWHPGYSERFLELVPLKQGDRVLCLACGTGLDAFLAAEVVCPGGRSQGEERTEASSGQVIAVDISRSMLDQAEEKLSSLYPRPRGSTGGRPVTFLHHDVTELDTLRELRGQMFDVVICSNAMVLFDDPAAVVRSWRSFLRPGGVLAVDVCHERETVAGRVLERVLKKMGVDAVEYPVTRAWIRGRESMANILEGEGFAVERTEELERVEGGRTAFLPGDEGTAGGQFEYVAMRMRRGEEDEKETVEVARKIFREEWAKEADTEGGMVELVNAMYVYIAKRK